MPTCGLQNPPKWLCFFNAALQALHATPVSFLEGEGPFTVELRDFFERMHTSMALDAKPLLESMGRCDSNPNRAANWLELKNHQDSQEAVHELFGIIRGEQRESSGVRSVFGIDVASQISCGCPLPANPSVERHYFLAVPVQGSLLSQCLAEYASREDLEQGTNCSQGWQSSATGKQLTATPRGRVLFIQLKRFVPHTTGPFHKINDDVFFPIKLDREYLSDSKLVGVRKCHLYAVISHHGESSSSGHYTVAVRFGLRWFRCDDSSVESVDEQDVLDMQAYLLFYEIQATRYALFIHIRIDQSGSV